jgi:hypothetical protein
MARAKLTVRKHVCAPPRRNVMPMESHSDGQNDRYFPRTLQTMLLALGYSESPLFIGVLRLLRWNSYLCMCMWSSMRGQRPIIFAASITWSRLPHRVGRLREAWERPHEKLWHCYDMKRRNKWRNHSTTTFSSHAWEGAKAVVMPARDRDHIGCFADQVKLTCALVWDLDKAIKEVNLLGEHEEESSQKIIELEALCKRLRENAQKLKEEKTTLEGMI